MDRHHRVPIAGNRIEESPAFKFRRRKAGTIPLAVARRVPHGGSLFTHGVIEGAEPVSRVPPLPPAPPALRRVVRASLCARAARHRRRWDKKVAAAAAAATSRRVTPGKAVHAIAADPESDRRRSAGEMKGTEWVFPRGGARHCDFGPRIGDDRDLSIGVSIDRRALSVQRVQIPR